MPSTTRAICLALLAAATFTGAAALAKSATLTYPVLQVLFVRQIVVLLSTVPSVANVYPAGLTTSRPALHALRVAGAFVALASDIWAVSVLPLATATTLGFSKVLLAVLFAGALLGERLHLQTLLAVLLGFLGICLIIQPSFQSEAPWHYAIPLLGALGAVVATLCVRVLSQTESTSTLLIYQAGCIGLVAGVPLIWTWVQPDLSGGLLLISIAACATLGQWAGIHALRLGQVNLVGPIEYTRALYAVILGWVFFDEPPGLTTIIGAVTVISACLLVSRRAV